MDKTFFQNVGIGIASLSFGAALSIFIYAATNTAGTAAWLLYATSFLLMLRFWWRYTTLFVQHAPSQTFWQFMLDFAISFFGILSVLFVKDIKTWTALIGAAMLASIFRCLLTKSIPPVRRTLIGAIIMLGIMTAAYFAAPSITATTLAGIIFAIVLAFVIYAANRQ